MCWNLFNIFHDLETKPRKNAQEIFKRKKIVFQTNSMQHKKTIWEPKGLAKTVFCQQKKENGPMREK